MPPRNPIRPAQHERGIALVTAVLVVLLASVLVVTFMTTSTGERSLSSNVQTAKISLYSADAGVRTQQQVLANLAKVKLDSCLAGWPGSGLVITNAANLFPNGTFTVASTNPAFSASGTIAYSDTQITPRKQAYDFRFTIQSTGSVRNTGTRSVQSNGILRVSAERGTFADYLLFTNRHSSASGTNVWFSSNSAFDGRVHTNTTFRFAYKPTFQDQVTQRDAQAYYYNGGAPVQLDANNNSTIDVPNFYGGFQRNQTAVPLPSNSYSQQASAIRYTSGGASAPPNAEINRYISGGSNTSSSVPADGIYLNQLGGALGGIYVQGSLDQCRMWADTVTNRQWYQLKQGTTCRTIMVDMASTQTMVWNGANTAVAPVNTYSQVPLGIMYVNGGISDLRGPDRSGSTVLPAIAQKNQMLIAATNDVVVERDVTLDDYSTGTNVLGIYSSNGSVRVGPGAPADCNLDAFVMAAGTSGEFAVDGYDTGSPRGIFHLRGGMTASYYGGFYTFDTSGMVQSGYVRDFHYDRRGLIPPFYPSTLRFKADTPTARTLAWKEI
ncbi:MAG: DUF4900 domain-containing protein [Candidatus Eisenbacteria bacterium]